MGTQTDSGLHPTRVYWSCSISPTKKKKSAVSPPPWALRAPPAVALDDQIPFLLSPLIPNEAGRWWLVVEKQGRCFLGCRYQRWWRRSNYTRQSCSLTVDLLNSTTACTPNLFRALNQCVDVVLCKSVSRG